MNTGKEITTDQQSQNVLFDDEIQIALVIVLNGLRITVLRISRSRVTSRVISFDMKKYEYEGHEEGNQ